MITLRSTSACCGSSRLTAMVVHNFTSCCSDGERGVAKKIGDKATRTEYDLTP